MKNCETCKHLGCEYCSLLRMPGECTGKNMKYWEEKPPRTYSFKDAFKAMLKGKRIKSYLGQIYVLSAVMSGEKDVRHIDNAEIDNEWTILG